MAGSRLFVHEDVHDQVVEGVAAHAASLVIGDSMRPETVLGPLISARQKARVEGYVQAGLEDGATLAYGHSDFSLRGLSQKGSFDSGSVGLYAEERSGVFFVDEASSLAYDHGTSTRTILLPGIARIL